MSIAPPPAIRPSVVTPEPEVTPEDLLHLNGLLRQGRFELVDGRAVKKPMSYTANRVAGKVAGELYVYLRLNPIADVLLEQEFQCFPGKPKQVRVPDLSVVLTTRVPVPPPTGYLRFVPDLAVEVVSPNDLVYNFDDKLEDYRSAGFPRVWAVNPDSRLVRIHVPGQPVVEVRAGQTLRCDDLLPGFAVPVDALMPAVAVGAA